MNWIKGVLADFPTTALRIVVTVGLVVGTALVCWYCFARSITLDESNFDSWLMFLAVMSGIDVAQWAVKRSTAWKPEVTATTTTSTTASPSATTTATTKVETVSTTPQLEDTATHRTPKPNAPDAPPEGAG